MKKPDQDQRTEWEWEQEVKEILDSLLDDELQGILTDDSEYRIVGVAVANVETGEGAFFLDDAFADQGLLTFCWWAVFVHDRAPTLPRWSRARGSGGPSRSRRSAMVPARGVRSVVVSMSTAYP